MPGSPVGGFGDPVPAAPLTPPLDATADDPVAMRIGLVDTGVVEQGGRLHPWFADRVTFGPSTGSGAEATRVPYGEADPLDVDEDGALDASDGHGTFVAGQILQNARTAAVTSMRVLGDDLGDDPSIAAAIAMLARDHKLINLSFGGSLWETAPPRVLQRALRDLPDDVLVVCSAGNFGDTRPHWPGAFAMELPESVVCVGAAQIQPKSPDGDVRWAPADFSTRGEWVSAYTDGHGLVGPYCWFTESRSSAERHDRSPVEFRGWASWSGTSFAAADVTGLIAAQAIADGHPDDPRAAWEALRQSKFSVDGRPLLLTSAMAEKAWAETSAS